MIYKAQITIYYGNEKTKETYLVNADSYPMAADMIEKYYEKTPFESMKLTCISEDVAPWPESLDIKSFESLQFM